MAATPSTSGRGDSLICTASTGSRDQSRRVRVLSPPCEGVSPVLLYFSRAQARFSWGFS
ncbi:hypothetical protein SMG44B_20811 [Stenotrophomonas maltophilia]